MKLKVSYIDVFTDTVFRGNPAAVIITDTWLADSLMQDIAIKNNLSETAFTVKTGDQYRALENRPALPLQKVSVYYPLTFA